ncbi:hypothetical protein AVEN_149777-1 [Araneus ventricosus]|uniref:Transposase Tc1-like domain-containing protein n=1 Tax=Araneus ventricosus TaxID=182803 RepID=A0A4Y2IZI6_ARAVE|nr:hypothetical protein AVEN_149777-1 [Araneus ventricosus]
MCWSSTLGHHKERGCQETVLSLVSGRSQTVAHDSPTTNAGQQVFGTHSSADTVDMDCEQTVPPTRVPLLTKRHSQLCLQWAREHRDWTMDEWKRVAWSNES